MNGALEGRSMKSAPVLRQQRSKAHGSTSREKGVYQGTDMHKFSVVLHVYVPPQLSSPAASAKRGGGGEYFFSLFGAIAWDSCMSNSVTKWVTNNSTAAVSAVLHPPVTRERVRRTCAWNKDTGCRWRELPYTAWNIFGTMTVVNSIQNSHFFFHLTELLHGQSELLLTYFFSLLPSNLFLYRFS